MGQRHILHCDCNCFYASVEMQEHPELRGKSIAVCGDPEARHGIVLTASYPAKRMGVKTAMPIWEAKQHYRALIVVPASYGKYQKYSSYVREIFRDYTDQVESFGLDEAWLDITGSLGLFGDPVKIAKEISDRIKRELGITVSIGVSFNKITAKLGSDYKKPDAITVIEPDNYKQIVYPLPVGDLFQRNSKFGFILLCCSTRCAYKFFGAEMRLLRPGMGTQYQEMESIPAKDMIPNQSRNAANIKKHIPPKTGFRGLFSVIRSGRVGS